MLTMAHQFRLVFGSDLGKNTEIRIPRARVYATQEEIVSAMDDIISSNAVMAKNGRPRNRNAARLVNTNTTNFQIGG